jgi:hypothetical protein
MIAEIIENNKKNFTTLTSFLAVLHKYIECLKTGRTFEGISSIEIKRIYDEYKDLFSSNKNYYESYVQRKANDKGYYYERNGKYFIKPEIINNENLVDLSNYQQGIIDLLCNNNNRYRIFQDTIQQLLDNPHPSECYQFILELFKNKDFHNFGQLFEVLSYSILKVYFDSFGFTLNRFSVSFSNDGGMDFISYQGIYQVTAGPSKDKAKSDLEKLIGVKRVIVITDCSDNIKKIYLENPNVTEVITETDLKEHFLGWLKLKNSTSNNHLLKIVEVFKYELSRETL